MNAQIIIFIIGFLITAVVIYMANIALAHMGIQLPKKKQKEKPKFTTLEIIEHYKKQQGYNKPELSQKLYEPDERRVEL